MANKETILRYVLRVTGNNPDVLSTDEEYITVSAGWDRVLPWVIELHPWAFAIKRSTELTQTAGGVQNERYSAALDLPALAVSVLSAFKDGVRFDDYEIVGRSLCCAHTQGVRVHYLAAPAESTWSPLFAEGFSMLVEAEMLRGFNEDEATAKDRREQALQIMALAKARNDGQMQRVKPRPSSQGRSAIYVGVLNDAILATGGNPSAEGEENDWLLGERAFSRVLSWASVEHRWNFSSKRSTALASTGAKSMNYPGSFVVPADSLKVLAVYDAGERTDEYEIVDNAICMTAVGDVTVHYLRTPPESAWAPAFTEGMTRCLEAEILRARAARVETAAEKELVTKEAAGRDERGRMLLAQARKIRDEQEPDRRPRTAVKDMTALAVSICNNALMVQGFNPLDESGESHWQAARRGYERAVAWMLQDHPWIFSRRVSAALVSAGNDNPRWGFSYDLPTNVVSLLSVYADGYPVDRYEVFGDELNINVDSDEVVVQFNAPADEETYTALFIEAATLFVEGAVLEGVPKREQVALAKKAEARAMLGRAKLRGDQQQPGKDIYQGYIRNARRYGMREVRG